MKNLTSKSRVINLLLTLAVILFVAGCGPKARRSEGHMDTPQVHYKQGMKFYEDGKLDKALSEFNLAKTLDHKYGPAYIGLSLVSARKGKFKEAYEYVDKAEKYDDDNPKVYIAEGIIITLEKQGGKDEDWYEDAIDAYDEALKKDPQSGEAHYRKGWTYKKAFMFSKAGEEFQKTLEINKDYTSEADKEWATVQKIQRAAPGTIVGKKIALIGTISRSDIAALFINELDVVKLIEKKRPKNYDTGFRAPETDKTKMKTETSVKKEAVTDVSGHWAENFIKEVVRLQIRGLSPYPDHTFRPDEKVTRSEYALMVEDVLIAILRDPSLATKHIGASKSRFPDVNPSSPYYNAICNAVDKNVMDAEMNGEFGISDPVSGAEALLVIRKLKELNK
ncbi:MAG: S-layer homology domain-containing protein [Fibrobacterota bacterium]